jgi:hypothetical protein
MTKSTKIISVVSIAAVAVVLWLTLPLPEDAGAFANTTNVVFTVKLRPLLPIEGRTNEFTSPSNAPDEDVPLIVSDPAAVRRLVAAVRLRRKAECQCGPHQFRADFQTPGGQIRVSFCSHCFDVLDPAAPTDKPWKGSRQYKLPPDFYAEFRSHVEQQTNLQWRLLRL